MAAGEMCVGTFKRTFAIEPGTGENTLYILPDSKSADAKCRKSATGILQNGDVKSFRKIPVADFRIPIIVRSNV